MIQVLLFWLLACYHWHISDHCFLIDSWFWRICWHPGFRLFTNSHSFPDIILTPSNSYSWCIITVVTVASCWCLECPLDWIQLAELTVPVCMSNSLPRIWTIISFHYLTKLLTLLLLFLAKDKQSFLICVSSGFKHKVFCCIERYHLDIPVWQSAAVWRKYLKEPM